MQLWKTEKTDFKGRKLDMSLCNYKKKNLTRDYALYLSKFLKGLKEYYNDLKLFKNNVDPR